MKKNNEAVIKIFARYHTSDKVLIACKREQVKDVQIMLAGEFGGNWLWVDQLDTAREFLTFDDGKTYRGFDEKIDRYVNGIETNRL